MDTSAQQTFKDALMKANMLTYFWEGIYNGRS